MAFSWWETGNGRSGFESVATGETMTVQADTGGIWKVINIFHSGGITLHMVDADGNDCEFHSTADEKGSLEFLNIQIQDSDHFWLEIDNDNASDNVIAVDAIVW
jgi:hypothetical protein